MANRQTTFLLKRSNVPGKIPPMSGLTIGELALNTADAILYTSGTTSNSILPIGWDRIHRTGDTVTGNFVFNGNIDVTSISPVDYIDFNTNPTVPSATGGTLYFDYNENALSYKPITNQNDVTVNLGQESLIKVYNDLPTTILNGQVLHITGATGSVPTVALANASKLGTTFLDSLAQSSGVATHDIPSGEYGFMTNFGIVRDLNTTAFTVGSEVFLSDTVDGALTNDPNNIAFTSRISTVGYCLESNSTTGKILVVITNENPLQSLTQQEINILLGNTISTGAYSYTGMTKASSTTVNVAPMRGWVVYNTYENSTNPIVISVNYSGGTNIPVTNINSSLDTYFLVNSGGTLFQQTTFPTPQERRENIFLGRAVHPNKTAILNVEQNVDYDVSPMSAIRDLWTPIKLINQGVIPSYSGANLSFKTSSGVFWGNGIGWDTNELNPNSINISPQIPAAFYYTTQTGGTFTTTTTTIDTLNYDVNGVITPVPGSGNYSTQRIYMSQSGVIRIQYGQVYYPTLPKAIAALSSEVFVENADNGIDCILIGTITVKDGTSDLSNIDDAVFSLVSKFGEVLGGTAGISTTTLQQAYNNSTSPEIVINATLDGLTIKNGTGNADNVTILLEGQTGTNGITSFIRADGYISGTTFQSNGFIGNSNGITATTVSATTYYNLPTDIRVTGGTYSDNTFTYTNNTGGTFNTLFNTMTGLTINGDLTVTGGTQSIFSGNSSSDLVRITQTGSGNALTIEDTTNPDSTPFVINATGSVGIGTTTPTAKLTVFTSAAIGYPATSGTSQTGYYSRLRNTTSNLVLDMGGNGAFGNWLQSTNQLDLSLTFPLLLNPNGGNVGIGAIDPQTNLHVSGSTLISGTLTATTISSTTINATNLYVTGGTQSIFSGSSSSELFRITQTGVGDAFVVEDSSNSDNSHFVINASGNTAIGLTQPIGDDKLTVSGNTTVYGTVSATTYAGGGVNNGKLLSITELTASTLATHTVATSTVFTAINCNSDATNRYAKITFTAPASAIVEIIFEADILFSNSAAVQMIGLHSGSTSTTTPSKGWFRINGDADASSASYRASFIINSLTPGTSYTYYAMTVCNFSGNLVRCGSRQTGAYVDGADRPSPLRIYARDIGTTVITTNPSS